MSNDKPPTIALNKTGSEAETEYLKDETCSMVESTKNRIENPDLGIKILKKCWYKLKTSKGLEGKWKELVRKVVSKRQIQELMTWAGEENIAEEEGVTKNAKKRLEELTAVTRVQQNCADMVASTLAKVLPE